MYAEAVVPVTFVLGQTQQQTESPHSFKMGYMQGIPFPVPTVQQTPYGQQYPQQYPPQFPQQYPQQTQEFQQPGFFPPQIMPGTSGFSSFSIQADNCIPTDASTVPLEIVRVFVLDQVPFAFVGKTKYVPVNNLSYATRELELSLSECELKTLNCRDLVGGTLLFWAVMGNQLETVQYLLKLGADPDIPNFGKFDGDSGDSLFSAGETPLHMASEAGNLEIMRELIEYGADINFDNIWDETPLFYCTSDEAVSNLLKLGANQNVRNVDGLDYLEYEEEYFRRISEEKYSEEAQSTR